MKKERVPSQHRRDIRLPPARVTIKEMQDFMKKAHLYSQGNLSRFIVKACNEFKEGKK